MFIPPKLLRHPEWTLFLFCLLVRVVFLFALRSAGAEQYHDDLRYDKQSSAILLGNFDLETPLFITAPLYSYWQALFKLLFGTYWLAAITAVQLVLSAWSTVFVVKIGELLFTPLVGWIAALCYAVYPLTLAYVGTPAQDMMFQVLWIMAVWGLLRALEKGTWSSIAAAASLFSLAFLTKAHILLFAPFIPVLFWLRLRGSAVQRALRIGLYVFVCCCFTLPHGLFNLHHHGLYVISSTGYGGHFMTGHNADTYLYIVDPPPIGSAEHTRIHAMDFHVMRELADTLKTLTHREKQALYLQKGWEWCTQHPRQLLRMSLYDLGYFLMPGVNPSHYGTLTWLAVLILSLPLYLLSYAGIIIALRKDPKKHAWIAAAFFAMILFSVGFYVQNRFRTITLEPFYMVYAAHAFVLFGRRWGLDRWLPFLRIGASD